MTFALAVSVDLQSHSEVDSGMEIDRHPYNNDVSDWDMRTTTTTTVNEPNSTYPPCKFIKCTIYIITVYKI